MRDTVKPSAIGSVADMYKRSELERLYRDVRRGGFHPANPLLPYEFIGKKALGVDISDPRLWS